MDQRGFLGLVGPWVSRCGAYSPSRRMTLMLPLASMVCRFDRGILQPLLAELVHQLLNADKLLAHVLAQHASVIDKLKIWITYKSLEGRAARHGLIACAARSDCRKRQNKGRLLYTLSYTAASWATIEQPRVTSNGTLHL
jgi:hypothetical protein